MTCTLTIPSELVAKMYGIRTNTGIPIRRRAIRAMERYIEEIKDKSIDKIIPA